MAWNEPEDETEYLGYLEHARHMFAWCLTRYSGLSPDVAAREATSFYDYQPASDPCRGLVFHDQAWHWAMLRIRGDFTGTPTEGWRRRARSTNWSRTPSELAEARVRRLPEPNEDAEMVVGRAAVGARPRSRI